MLFCKWQTSLILSNSTLKDWSFEPPPSPNCRRGRGGLVVSHAARSLSKSFDPVVVKLKNLFWCDFVIVEIDLVFSKVSYDLEKIKYSCNIVNNCIFCTHTCEGHIYRDTGSRYREGSKAYFWEKLEQWHLSIFCVCCEWQTLRTSLARFARFIKFDLLYEVLTPPPPPPV